MLTYCEKMERKDEEFFHMKKTTRNQVKVKDEGASLGIILISNEKKIWKRDILESRKKSSITKYKVTVKKEV